MCSPWSPPLVGWIQQLTITIIIIGCFINDYLCSGTKAASTGNRIFTISATRD